MHCIPDIRSGGLEEFFQHENQACPPAPSEMGVLRIGTKSNLLTLVRENVSGPTVQVTILDMLLLLCD